MGFEKRVLEVAEECGIEDAYFYEGTMFFNPDNSTIGMVDNFREVARKMFPACKLQMSDVGKEIAVDFVLA